MPAKKTADGAAAAETKKKTAAKAEPADTKAKKSAKADGAAAADKIADGEALKYRGRALVRSGNTIIYGNPEDPYLVSFEIRDTEKVGDLSVAKNVIIQLMMNGYNEDVTKNRPVKRAERDSLYDAIDIGSYWLEDILKQVN